MLAEDADVIIEDYSSPVRITGGIAGTEFVRNTILIDYDTKKVTFCLQGNLSQWNQKICITKNFY